MEQESPICNIHSPILTQEEKKAYKKKYANKRTDKRKNYESAYNNSHKKEKREWYKKWYAEKRKVNHSCACGGTYNSCGRVKHMKTKKHWEYIKNENLRKL